MNSRFSFPGATTRMLAFRARAKRSPSCSTGFTLPRNVAEGFTLIELLVTIAVVAILSVVVILVLNPAELVKQARDSNRLQDLANINTALNLFQTDTGGTVSMGSASTTYVSIADPVATSTLGDQCQGLGLPALPTGWSYHCAASSTYRLVNGTGWVPVDFTQISFKSPLALLPVDPVNSTSSGNYYSYVPGGSWALTSLFESQKYLAKSAAQDGGYDPGRYEVGTDLSLVAKSEGLVGWWNFEEGSGTTANDASGNGNMGTWSGTGSHWTGGKVGGYAGQFNGTDDYVNTSQTLSTPITVTGWVRVTDFTKWMNTFLNSSPHTVLAISLNRTGIGNIYVYIGNGSGWLGAPAMISSVNMVQSVWHHVTFTSDGSVSKLYLDAALVGTSTLIPSGWGSYYHLGDATVQAEYMKGQLDDVRIYNRALSAAEISAIYNALK